MSTLDAHLVALDARTGNVLWNAEVQDSSSAGYSKTAAPLVVGDKVFTGVAGGEYGIRGLVDAYDIESGERGVALLHDAQPRPSRQPDLVGRLVAHRRLRHVDDRLLRPRAEPHLLGHGQPGTGLRRHRARGRQPLFRLRRGPRRRHGRAPLVLPVHAARHPRLGLDADPGAGRHGVRGRAAQADALPEPQRVLLRARPRDRRVPARDALRAADLGPRASTRPAGPSCSPARSRPRREPSSPPPSPAAPTGGRPPTAPAPASST